MTADRRFVVARLVQSDGERCQGGLTDRHVESMRVAVLTALPGVLLQELRDRVVVERLSATHVTVTVPLIVERPAADALIGMAAAAFHGRLRARSGRGGYGGAGVPS